MNGLITDLLWTSLPWGELLGFQLLVEASTFVFLAPVTMDTTRYKIKKHRCRFLTGS